MTQPRDNPRSDALSTHRWYLLGIFDLYPYVTFLMLIAYVAAGFVAYWLADDPTPTKQLALIGLVVVPTLVLGVLVPVSRRGTREVVIREDGIEWVDDEGRFSRPWDQVREVYCNWVVGGADTDVSLRVVFRDEVELVARQTLRDYKALCRSVQERALPGILEEKKFELQRDGAATFGPVVVSADGFRYATPAYKVQGGPYHWAALGDWRIVNGAFTVRSARGAFVANISHTEVPNFLAFLMLVECLWKPPMSPTRFGWHF